MIIDSGAIPLPQQLDTYEAYNDSMAFQKNVLTSFLPKPKRRPMSPTNPRSPSSPPCPW